MAPQPREVFDFIWRSSKRIAVTIVGGAFVIGGLAMLVLPGPGIIVVALGFAILATEYVWAAMALERTKRVASQVGDMARGGAKRVGREATGTARSVRQRFSRR